MKITHKFYLFLIIIFLIIDFVLLYKFLFIVNVIIYDMDINITESSVLGFNLDSDKLHFGNVPNNSIYAYRNIEFENIYDYPIELEFESSGEMSKYITYEYLNQNLVLEPDERATVKVIFSNNKPLESQLMEGKLIILVYKK